MLWTISVVFLFLWLLGMATAYSFGGVIHVLLVLAVITILVRVVQRRGIAS